MHNALYFTLAKSNLKKNRAIYLPYLLANVLIVSMYYILTSIRSMMQTYETTQGSNTDLMLRFCTVVAVIMAFIILFYVNSFVIRQRKKEIGLYCVLGMEKRHLSVMMLWEVVLTSLGGIVGGIVSGALFSQLAFLVFLALLRIPSDLRFEIPLGAVGNTCAVFGVLYLLVLCYNLLSILRTSPISFLSGRERGREGTESEKDSCGAWRDLSGNRVWPRTVCRWHLRDNQSVPSCGAAGDFRHIFPLFGGQYRFVEMDETAGAVLLPSEKFHYRIRDALPDEAKCGRACDDLYFVHRRDCVGLHQLQSVPGGRGHPETAVSERLSCKLYTRKRARKRRRIFRRELSIRQRRTASP